MSTRFKTRPKKSGRKPIPLELRRVQKMTPEHVKLAISKLSKMTYAELSAHLEHPKTLMLEMMVGNIMKKAFETGDSVRTNFLFDRAIGKVAANVEVELKPVTYRTEIKPDGSLLQQIMAEESERPGLPSLENSDEEPETLEAQVVESDNGNTEKENADD